MQFLQSLQGQVSSLLLINLLNLFSELDSMFFGPRCLTDWIP